MIDHEFQFVEEYDGGFVERGRTWTLVNVATGATAWTVNRRDIGPHQHVLRAEQHSEELPAQAFLVLKTHLFVRRLLEQIGLTDDPFGWVANNLTAMLTLASSSIDSWSGNEWAVNFEPNIWLPDESPRRVYSFVCAHSSTGQALFTSYQDFDFGLGCEQVELVEVPALRQPDEEVGSGTRAGRALPAVTGRIRAVEVLFHSNLQQMELSALPVEVAIHGSSGESSLILSGDQYLGWDGDVSFSRFDTEVTLVPDARIAGKLDWRPPRPDWVRWGNGEPRSDRAT